MTRHYYVNPTTRTPDPRIWVEGRLVSPSDPLPNGRSGFNVAHVPAFDLYVAVEDTRTPAENEAWRDNEARYILSFSGTIGDDAARVTEVADIIPRDIDNARIQKQAELSNQIDLVRHANCVTNLTPNWVVRIELSDREWIASVNGFLQDRMRDRVYDADPKDYWARDVPLRIININTNRYLTESVNESQWGQIMKDIGLHDFQTVDAADLVQADIDAAVAADDIDALLAIDVREPAYGWPPVYRPEVSPTGNGR